MRVSRWLRRTLAIALVAMAAALAVGVPFAGAGKSFSGSLTFTYQPGTPPNVFTFSGQLTTAQLCRKNRRLLIYTIRTDGSLLLSGSSPRTDRTGAWSVTFSDGPPHSGDGVYAIAKRKTVKKNGKTVVCRSSRSENVVIP